MKTSITSLLVILLLTAALANANRRTQEYVFKRSVITVDIPVNFITGEYNTRINKIDDSFWAKSLLGYGLSYQRYFTNQLAFGASFAKLHNKISFGGMLGSDIKSTLTSFSGYVTFSFSREFYRRPYFKIEYGKIKGKTEDLGNSLESEYTTFYTLATGVNTISYKNVVFKFEVFYRSISTEDLVIFGGSSPQIADKLNTFGLQIGVGYNFNL